MEQIKNNLLTYLHSFSIYDAIAFGWLGFLLLILFVLVVLLARKKPRLATFLLLISILALFIGPFGIKYFLDKSVRKVDLKLEKTTQLNFAKSLVVNGTLTNSALVRFHTCQINATIYHSEKNPYKNMLSQLNPLRSKTIKLDKALEMGESEPFKIIFENFDYKGDYNVSLTGSCY